jgi:serine/threonine protein kinase
VPASWQPKIDAEQAAPPPTPPPPPPPPPPTTTTTPPLYTSRSYVIDGLSFEVDARYKIRTMVGKGAYGLVCAGEDTRPPPETEPTACSSPVVPSSSDNSFDARTPDAQYDARSPGAHAAAEAASTRARPAPAMVAVKKVLDPFHDHTDCKRLLREVRLLRSLRHPNVLHLTDLMPPPSLSLADWTDVYLVTRLLDTNLHRVISTRVIRSRTRMCSTSCGSSSARSGTCTRQAWCTAI